MDIVIIMETCFCFWYFFYYSISTIRLDCTKILLEFVKNRIVINSPPLTLLLKKRNETTTLFFIVIANKPAGDDFK